MVTGRAAGDSGAMTTRHDEQSEILMYQLTQQLADEVRRSMLERAERQRPARRMLALRRAERPERHSVRRVWRLRVQPEA